MPLQAGLRRDRVYHLLAIFTVEAQLKSGILPFVTVFLVHLP